MATNGDELARGLDCLQRGAPDEAEPLFRQALEAEPRHAEAHYYLGLTLHGQGRLAEAVASFQQALQCRPNFPEAYSALGATFQNAVQDRRNSAAGHLAVAATKDGSYQGIAVGPPSQALEYDDLDAQCLTAERHNQLAFPLFCEGKVEEALAHLHQALRLDPYYAEAYLNLGCVRKSQGKLDESLACSEKAMRLKPDFAQAHLVHAQTLLSIGDFERGWQEYEWRWRCPYFGTPLLTFSMPRWDGSPLNGRTILLRAEQGLGDTIHFVRYAPLLQQQGAKVVVECQPPLVPLLRSCPGIDRLVAQGEIPLPFDVFALLLSLPALMGTTLATVPANVPYLFADPALVAHWRQELSSIQGFKIGIVWQGSTAHEMDRLRSVPLTKLAPLAGVEGIQLISLQKDEGTEQLSTLAGQFAVTELGSQLKTFMDTAAVLMSLDLVVTVDTAVAHLAGALGVPVWVALPFSSDWRWILGRDDSPWYPSMRLFRPTQPGNYAEVFARIASEVHKKLSVAGEPGA